MMKDKTVEGTELSDEVTDKIYDFNMDLSFPRRNDGTTGHKKAIDFIENTLDEEGIEYNEQAFYWKNLRKRRRYTQKIPMLILSIRILIGLIMAFFQDHTVIMAVK